MRGAGVAPADGTGGDVKRFASVLDDALAVILVLTGQSFRMLAEHYGKIEFAVGISSGMSIAAAIVLVVRAFKEKP